MGRNPQMMKRVIIRPEPVSSVTYHIRAYWTSEVPIIDSTWVPRNTAVVACHEGRERMGRKILRVSRRSQRRAAPGTGSSLLVVVGELAHPDVAEPDEIAVVLQHQGPLRGVGFPPRHGLVPRDA